MAAEEANKEIFNAQVYPGTCLLLYVDDDNVNQQVLDMLLSTKVEYRVLLACDQQEVEEILKHEQYLPDVVFMDNQLVDCTGVEVIAWMRERYSADLAFVMCTARSQAEAKKLAVVANAQGYLCKPYTMKDLLSVLSELTIPHLPTSLPLTAHNAESDAPEALQVGSPSMQALKEGFNNPSVPLGTLVRTAASALQGCQTALTALGSRSTHSCGSGSSDTVHSTRIIDQGHTDGVFTTPHTTSFDRDRAAVGQGRTSASSPHSSFDVNDTASGPTMAEPARPREHANVGCGPGRTSPSDLHWHEVVDGGQRHAGYSHHTNEAVASMGTVLQQGGWLVPSLSSEATLSQPTVTLPKPAAAKTATPISMRPPALCNTPRDHHCPISVRSSSQGALGLNDIATAPVGLLSCCVGRTMTGHRGSWPQAVSPMHTMSAQMPGRTVGLGSRLTESCTSAPANVLVSHMTAAHKQVRLPGRCLSPRSEGADAEIMRLGGLRSLNGSGSATWRDARRLDVSGCEAGPQSSAEYTGDLSLSSSWQSNVYTAVPARESPTQAWWCNTGQGDITAVCRQRVSDHSPFSAVHSSAPATIAHLQGDCANPAVHACSPGAAGTPARFFIAATCAPGAPVVPEPLCVAPTVSRQIPPGSCAGNRESSSVSQPANLASTPIAAVQPGSVQADTAGDSTSKSSDSASSWGPVWVRLDPPKDAKDKLEHAVIIGAECLQAPRLQPSPKRLPVGCALTADVLQAELQSLRIASGAKEAEDIAQAVQRVVTLLNLPAACTSPRAYSAGALESDDSLSLDDLLQVLGISSACVALRNKGLTVSQLKCMSAMQVMQQGVIGFSDLEALMDALYSL